MLASLIVQSISLITATRSINQASPAWAWKSKVIQKKETDLKKHFYHQCSDLFFIFWFGFSSHWDKAF